MTRSFRVSAGLLIVLALLAAVPPADAQTVIVSPPMVHYSRPVVTYSYYYTPPVVSYYAPPAVSCYPTPAVAYYYAPATTTTYYRSGVLGRRVPTTTYYYGPTYYYYGP